MSKNNNEITLLNGANSAPLPAVKKVVERLPELTDRTNAFGRGNSQTTLSMMSLTMLTGHSPHRQIRQILAEIEVRQIALAEAQVAYEKLQSADVDKTLPWNIQQAQLRLNSFNLIKMENKIAGSFKDLATLINTYDALVAKHGLEDWDEEAFEAAEVRHHVRRGFELLYRDIATVGRPKESTIEYMQQFGVHVQVAEKEVHGYMAVVNNIISQGGRPSSAHLEDFLDQMADKYQDNAKEISMRMYGVEMTSNPDYMSKYK